MKDIFGFDVKIGDYVIVRLPSHNNFELKQVSRLGNKGVFIKVEINKFGRCMISERYPAVAEKELVRYAFIKASKEQVEKVVLNW